MVRQLTKVKLHEVSLVDSPANKLARVMLFKRAGATGDGNYPSAALKREFSADERKGFAKSGAAMSDGSFPISNTADLANAIHAIGRAKDVAMVKAHIRSRAKVLDATNKLPESWDKRDSGNAVMKFAISKDAALAKNYGDGEAVDFDAAQQRCEESEVVSALMHEVDEAVCSLGSAIWSIQADDTLNDKGAAISASLDQFSEHVKTVVPEGVENALVAQALSQAGYTLNAQGGIELSKGVDSTMTMHKDIAKALGLPETTSEADLTAAVIKVAGTELKDLRAQLEKANALASLTGAEKVRFEKLDATAQPEFLKMSAADRKKQMDAEDLKDEAADEDLEKRIAKGEAFRTDDGAVLTKKDFGSDAGFAFAKAQAASNKTLRDQVAKQNDEGDIRKRTDVVKSEIGMIGKADDVAMLLHEIGKKDPKLADRAEALLKSANVLIKAGSLFGERGSSMAGESEPTHAITKLATELVKADPKLSMEKARGLVRKQNPELRAREEDATKARVRAN